MDDFIPTPIKEEHFDGIPRWEYRSGTKYLLPIFKCPYGQPGDLLWVRESYRTIDQDFGLPRYEYKVSEKIDITSRWKPSIHMPKAAARIWLQVESVKAERLNLITEADAIKEGVEVIHKSEVSVYRKYNLKEKLGTTNPVLSYETLWESINGPKSWEENPWVWVVEFSVLSTTGKPSL